MYVQEDFAGVTAPTGFSVIDYAYDSKTIPALSDGTYIMIFLKLPDGTAADFYVVNEDDSFTKLITVTVGGAVYSILPAEEIPAGYTATSDYMIGEVAVPAYKSDKTELSDFITVYAKGPGGQNGFYNYDTVDQTMQRAIGLVMQSEVEDEQDNTDSEEINIIETFNELNTNGKIVAITILAIILLLIIAIVVLIVKIATSGRDKKEAEEEEDFLFEDEDSVGFEYISVGDPVAPQTPVEKIPETPEIDNELPIAEETEASEQETEETTEDASDDKPAAHDKKEENDEE